MSALGDALQPPCGKCGQKWRAWHSCSVGTKTAIPEFGAGVAAAARIVRGGTP